MKTVKQADIIDVANHAGVSPATVSRTLNHPDMVKPDTRKRIQNAIEATGYIRNRAAQAIHGRRSGTVGLIVPTLDNAIFANLIQAFSDQLNISGFTMLVATHGYDLDREYTLLRSLLEHRVEGVGLIGLDHNNETYSLIKHRNTPCVAMWNYMTNTRIPCIGVDNYEAGGMITQHVLDLGHRDIAVVFPDSRGNDRASRRLQGVLDTLKQAKIEISPDRHVHTPYSIKHAREAVMPLLSGVNKPTAIISGNDVIAQGVIYAAHSLGISIPDEISVAGIGDFSGSAHLYPSLSTVRLRPNKVGLTAGLLLDQMINQKDQASIGNVAITSELIIRESTKAIV